MHIVPTFDRSQKMKEGNLKMKQNPNQLVDWDTTRLPTVIGENILFMTIMKKEEQA